MSEEKKFLVVFLCAASIVLGIFLIKNKNISECYVYKEGDELVEVPTQQECQFFYDELTGHSFVDSEDKYYSLSSIDYYTTNAEYLDGSIYWTVHAILNSELRN